MTSDLNIIAGNLADILKTPISIKVLEKLTDKEHKYLKMMMECAREEASSWAFYYKEKEEAIETIYEILDNCKARIEPKYRSPKAEAYLQTKKIYD